ncbi:MAG TPA: hypothetical protein PLI16_00200 [Bacteroidales bacterium]|nr:hypothetical protein [Bacteroidales bacterium]HOH83008.1 hypothetical protein [Bacteroidales bacterium]
MINPPKTHFFQDPGKTFVFFSALAVIIILLSANLPFFWDNITISEYINFYLRDSFRHIIPPLETDFGPLTINALYLAACCAIFGKTLLVCHLAIIPVVVGIFLEIKKISLRFIKPELLPMVYLLLLFDPAFITQIILMGYDLFLLYFVLLAIRSLLEKKHLLYSLSLLLLAATSFRALFFIPALALIHFMVLLLYDKTRPQIKDVLVYLPAMFFLISWSIIHYLVTGWIIINPANVVHISMNGPAMVIRQFIYILWKITDSGKILPWLFCILCILVYYRKLRTHKLKLLLWLLFAPLAVNSLIMIFLSNPVGHKYFLQSFVFLIILTVYFLQQIHLKKIRLGIFLLILAGFFAGNFIFYPQKYGNAWETSLKVLPYFSLEKDLAAYVKHQGIRPGDIYSFYPVTNNQALSWLDEDFAYADASHANMDTCRYVITSNVYNIKNPEAIHAKAQQWIPLKHFSRGQVYLKLYKNPAR